MNKWLRAGAAAAIALIVAGCGGGGGGSDTGTGGGGTPATSVKQAIDNAAASPANDTSVNSTAPFSVVQQAGVPAFTTAGATPKVNFAVFTGGQVKTDLKLTDVSFAVAKL